MTGIRPGGSPWVDDRQVETSRSAGQESYQQLRAPYPAGAYDVEGGSLTQGIAGAGAAIMAILALIGVWSVGLTSVATIAAGFALLIGGAAIAARHRRLMSGAGGVRAGQEVAGGMALGAFAGLAGVVLGVLALLGVQSVQLVSISAIVLGGALMMMSGAAARLEGAWRARESALQRGVDTMYVASGGELLVGAAAIILGILALSGVASLTLAAIAMLCIGIATLVTGTSVASRVFSMFG